MDFNLSNEQRSWRKSAAPEIRRAEEIRPITLERDTISTPRETEIIEKGYETGFRTMAVPKEVVGHRFRRPGAGDDRTRQGRQRHLQGVQPELEMEPLEFVLHRGAEAALPAGLRRRRHLVLGKVITEPSAGSDNRMPMDDPKTIDAASTRQQFKMLNGEKAFMANAPIGKLFFIDVAPQAGHDASSGPARPASASARCSTRAAGVSTRTAK